MKKLILLLSFTFLYLFASENTFLEPEDAFKPKVTQTEEKIIFEVELGEKIYLYNDKLKVLLTQPQKIDLTSKAIIPAPTKYDKYIVNFGDPSVKIEILKSEIELVSGSKEYEIEFRFQGCDTAGLCYAPMKESLKVGETNTTSKPIVNSETTSLNETDVITSTFHNKSFIVVLLTFFGFGLLLALTPCVFPMIPILSSIIAKEGNKGEMSVKKGFFLSLLYVVSMSFANAIAGVIAGMFGANLQVAMQNPYALVIFSFIFVALALSMFGYFRIEAPHWLQSRVYKTTTEQKGHGIIGIMIMGFLSALIVGPCVAPPLAGALVYIGQTGDALLGGLALFVMSIGMGVPLLIIGAGAGKFMPKPGGWMNAVSKLFGIVMLGIAIWMLERVIFGYALYLWAFLFIGTAIYLHQEYSKYLITKTITIVIFVYGIFLFMGAVSGANNVLNPLEKFTQGSTIVSAKEELKWIYVKNLEELDKAIKSSSKPVMLDFYATWCVACVDLEEGTFKDERVVKELKKFTLLKADVSNNSDDDIALQKKFGVFGPPALIFFDKNKQEIKEAQIIGYKNADEFLQIVNKSFK